MTPLSPSLARIASVLVPLALFAALAAVPILGPRALVQDLFSILTLLVLALNWNMLAGFAGLADFWVFVGGTAGAFNARTLLSWFFEG